MLVCLIDAKYGFIRFGERHVVSLEKLFQSIEGGLLVEGRPILCNVGENYMGFGSDWDAPNCVT